jgi:hypothetical protein
MSLICSTWSVTRGWWVGMRHCRSVMSTRYSSQKRLLKDNGSSPISFARRIICKDRDWWILDKILAKSREHWCMRMDMCKVYGCVSIQTHTHTLLYEDWHEQHHYCIKPVVKVKNWEELEEKEKQGKSWCWGIKLQASFNHYEDI